MSIVLRKNLSKANKMPISYVVGVDYPTGAPSQEKEKLFFNSPQGLDMASTAQSVLDEQRGDPLIGISGNIPPHILKKIPKTGRTMWVFFNRVMPHSKYQDKYTSPEALPIKKITGSDEELKKDIVQQEGFSKGLFWIEGGIKLLKAYEVWNAEVKPKDKPNADMRPWWYGWTKELSNYIVGAKIVYFPPKLVRKLYDDYQAGKIKLTHMDRFVNSLNPIRGEAITKNRSKMPKLEMFCLFEKKSNYGTKHNPALKCDKPVAEFKYNSSKDEFVYVGDDERVKKEIDPATGKRQKLVKIKGKLVRKKF